VKTKAQFQFITIILFLFFLFTFILFPAAGTQDSQKVEWKGEITTEKGVKVVKNPREPLYGKIKFNLEEDLSIGREDDENYLFYMVRGIALDSKHNIYVTDWGNHRIQKFDSNGVYLQTIGRHGQGPGEFETIMDLKIDKQTGDIYVLDSSYYTSMSSGAWYDSRITFYGYNLKKLKEITSALERTLKKNPRIKDVRISSSLYGRLETFEYILKIDKETVGKYDLNLGYLYYQLRPLISESVNPLKVKISGKEMQISMKYPEANEPDRRHLLGGIVVNNSILLVVIKK
jgi:hypothetical protein